MSCVRFFCGKNCISILAVLTFAFLSLMTSCSSDIEYCEKDENSLLTFSTRSSTSGEQVYHLHANSVLVDESNYPIKFCVSWETQTFSYYLDLRTPHVVNPQLKEPVDSVVILEHQIPVGWGWLELDKKKALIQGPVHYTEIKTSLDSEGKEKRDSIGHFFFLSEIFDLNICEE